MKDELIDELVESYPLVFKEIKHDVAIGDGWYRILKSLSSIIEQYNKNIQYNRAIKPNVGLRARIGRFISDCLSYVERYFDIRRQDKIETDVYYVQVKEKFGELRVYINRCDDFVDGAVTMAEELSRHTCEDCGAEGEIRNVRGWLSALCDDCHTKSFVKD